VGGAECPASPLYNRALQGAPLLEELELSFNQITDIQAVDYLIESCPRLRRLQVWEWKEGGYDATMVGSEMTR
jgi:hypothetical protein